MTNYQYPPPESWADFELLSKDLLSEKLSLDFKAHGRNGSKQYGVDSYAQCDDESYYGIQCKKKEIYPEKKITIDEVEKECDKALSFNPPLSHLSFFTTGRKTVKLQKEERELNLELKSLDKFSIDIYFWDDIEELLNKHATIAEYFYSNKNKSVVSRSQNFEKLTRSRDIENLEWILSIIHFPTLDEHYQDSPRVMDGNVLTIWDAYRSTFLNSLFHLYDIRLKRLFSDLYKALNESTRYFQFYQPNHNASAYYFSNPGDAPLTKEQEPAW